MHLRALCSDSPFFNLLSLTNSLLHTLPSTHHSHPLSEIPTLPFHHFNLPSSIITDPKGREVDGVGGGDSLLSIYFYPFGESFLIPSNKLNIFVIFA